MEKQKKNWQTFDNRNSNMLRQVEIFKQQILRNVVLFFFCFFVCLWRFIQICVVDDSVENRPIKMLKSNDCCLTVNFLASTVCMCCVYKRRRWGFQFYSKSNIESKYLKMFVLRCVLFCAFVALTLGCKYLIWWWDLFRSRRRPVVWLTDDADYHLFSCV